jgi:2-oxoglutarate ferredoxin oxidoreductase subunit delta
MPVKGRIVVSEAYCKGCELCIGACPQKVMRLSAERITAKGYHPAELIDAGSDAASGCTGCGICAVVCPEAAIVVYRETLRREPALSTASIQ